MDCGHSPGHGGPHHPPPRRQPPRAPTRLQADAVSSSEIQLSWRDNSDNEAAFEVERARIHHRHPLRWSLIATVSANVTSFTDTGLEPDTTYWYRVRAVNCAGHSGYSNPTWARTALVGPKPCGHSIVGWGYYNGHQYGPIPTVANPKAVFASSLGLHSFAIQEDGKAVSWSFGGFKDPDFPTNLTDVVAIAATDAQGLALKENGEVVQWGYYGYPFPVPTPDNLTNVVAITAGYSHFLALKGDGTVVGWGYPPGVGAETPPAGLTNVVAIAAGWYHSIALKKDGTVVAWGGGSFGETNIPANLTDVVAIAAAQVHNLALKSDGTIVGWGSFGADQTPPADGLSNIVAIATSDSHSIVLKDDGTVFQWGYAPNMPEGLGGVTSIAAGHDFSLVLTVAPPVPTLPVPLIINTSQMDLSWRDNFADELGFKIERSSELGDGQMGPWGQIATVGPDVTNYSDFDVMINHTYRYRLRSFNSCAESVYTEPREIKVAPPDRLDYLAVNSLGGIPSLRWYTTDARAQGFEIERAPDIAGQPGEWMQVIAGGADAFPSSHPYFFDYADTGLAAGTYWYRVRAVNALGKSDYSDSVSVTISLPNAPYSLNGSVGDHSFDLNWGQDPPNQQGFKLERAPDLNGQPGTWAEIATVLTTLYYGNYSDTNVTPNTTNWYRVRAFNAVGISAYSDPISMAIVPPDPPSDLSAYAYRDQAFVHWFSFGVRVDFYTIERALDNVGTPGEWTQVAAAEKDNSFIDTGLLPHQTYWYRVRASNWAGDSPYSDPVRVAIVPPVAPQYLQGAMGASNQIHLEWYQNPSDEDGFIVEWAPNVGHGPGAWTPIATVLITNWSNGAYTDTNVVANSTNWYRVRAFSLIGTSPPGDPVSVTALPPGIPAGMGLNAEHNRARIFWNSSSGFVEGYELERAPDVNGSPGLWTQITATGVGAFFEYTDGELAPDTTYWYRVRAFNWCGDSPYRGPYSVTIVPPATPQIISVLPGATNHVDLQIYENPAFEDGFRIQRFVGAGLPLNWTTIATIYCTNEYLVNFTDTNVAAFTTNWYRVQAFSETGNSPFSDPVSMEMVPPETPLFAAVPSARQVQLSWYIFWLHGQPQGLRIERAPDIAGAPGMWTSIVVFTNSIGTEYWDADVETGHAYWYRAQVFNWTGASDWSAPAFASLTPPDAPLDLVATAVAQNMVQLTWTNTSTNVFSFEIYRAPDLSGVPGDWQLYAYADGHTNSYFDLGVSPGETWWYRVRAFSFVGESPYSDAVVVTLGTSDVTSSGGESGSDASAPPVILSLTPSNNDLVVTWSGTGGTTNFIQARTNVVDAFSDLSSEIVLDGSGRVTNSYLDVGALTNAPARYYRVRSGQ